tara:strand:- start:170 stop:421 length:252 start_codon:yes stop_codon:yes gene_type:complete
MARFIDGIDREQVTLFPDRLEDWIGEDHLVRVVDLFVEELDLPALGFERCAPARTGRPNPGPARPAPTISALAGGTADAGARR